ncbi:MAG: PVC-type heme-binding CxxCH protein [Bacteroidota bacterium]
MSCRYSILLVLGLMMAFGACQQAEPNPQIDFSSLSEQQQRQAANALASMQTAKGLDVELFAAEPLLINPTNISVDEKGRVWLCEANNYRMKFNPDNPYREEGDRILILEDTDGDGKADLRKVYYQGEDINAALGITVLGNRVIVSSSPNVFVFIDDDGDDLPDRRDTLFTGIGGLDDDHAIHAFSFGPDGRFYFNFGNAGKQLKDKKGNPLFGPQGQAIEASGEHYRQGMVFRCEPDGSGVEVLGHNFRNIYEVAVDDFGTLWQSDNDDDGYKGVRINYVMEYGNYGYRDQRTGAGWRDHRVGWHEEIPKRHWHQNDPGVVPNLLQTGSGSPCGMLVYNGQLLPEVFQGQMIHCEAGHQVVRAYPVQKSGAGYTAEVLNVLKSEDLWFRPSDLAVAPDGSLLIADWYDAGVGSNKMADAQRGRIYRVAPNVSTYKTPTLDLSSPEAAVKALGSPNQATAYLAWTQLKEWGPNAAPALEQVWQSARPSLRARALWLLARLPDQTQTYIQQGLQQANEDLRICALRVARQLDGDHLLDYTAALLDDPSAAVRREVAIALRYIGTAEAAEQWAQLARQYDGKDRWYLEALGIGADQHPDLYFEAWLKEEVKPTQEEASRHLIWRIHAQKSLALLAEIIRDPNIDEQWLPRYFRAFHFKDFPNKDLLLAELLDIDHPLKKQITTYTLGQFSPDAITSNASLKAKVRALLPNIVGTPEWLAAIKSMQLKSQIPQMTDYFLENGKDQFGREVMRQVFEMESDALLEKKMKAMPQQEQMKVMANLAHVHQYRNFMLLRRWLVDGNPPYVVQRQLVESLGNLWDGQHMLYDWLREGKLKGELKTTAVLKIMNCWNPEIRFNAPRYLASAREKDGALLPPVAQLVDQDGDVARGKVVYERLCANCHQVDGQGISFGPDLSAIGSKLSKQALYNAILYPSAGINFGYEGYLIKLKNEAVYSGYITSETQEELKLRIMGGTDQVIAKRDILSQQALEQSLMTPNLQALMKEKELIDLVEYLGTLKQAAISDLLSNGQ